MTRINYGIHPSELHIKHLQAEHYEMVRIPNAIKKQKAVLQNIPSTFKLGTGHVKFFYNNLGYLKRRYEAVYAMCIARNIDVTYYGESFDGLPEECMKDIPPTIADRDILIERLQSRKPEFYKNIEESNKLF